MTFLQAVILQCLQKINGERTIYSVFHLLTGKKSSQTIQDAHLYQITELFKIVPNLKRQQFDNHIQILLNQQYLIFVDSGYYSLTNHGHEASRDYFHTHPFPIYIHGWKYQDSALSFWKRLTLFVQTLSHLQHSSNRFYPIQRDTEIQQWLKHFLLSNSSNRRELAKQVYDEFSLIFQSDFPENPSVIVSRLSGYQLIGLTNSQASEMLEMESSEYYFRFLNGLHYMIQLIVTNGKRFPILHQLISDQYQTVPYTTSTYRTYQLLQQNYTIAEIAELRKLRVSTIEDHIIEIALLNPRFEIDPFISKEDTEEIIQIAKQIGHRKLKPIKERRKNNSYFQIRLSLAKLGGQIE